MPSSPTPAAPPNSATALGPSVVIGRFQPPHKGHLALLAVALQRGQPCLVALGSAQRARSPKNPWTWQERKAMLLASLGDQVAQADVHFLPLRDRFDTALWAQDLHTAVSAVAGKQAITLMGHFKDSSSSYLRAFARWPDWTLQSLPSFGDYHATALRAALYTHILAHFPQQPATALPAQISAQLAPACVAWLQNWLLENSATALRLAQEWDDNRRYLDAWKGAPYAPVFVTVDIVLRCQERILLIQRGGSPGKGLWALPGGYLETHESTFAAALRELREETEFDLSPEAAQAYLRGSKLFDHPERSLRGRILTQAYYFDLGAATPLPTVQGADDALHARWFTLAEVLDLEPQLHDDHFHILRTFLNLEPVPLCE